MLRTNVVQHQETIDLGSVKAGHRQVRFELQKIRHLELESVLVPLAAFLYSVQRDPEETDFFFGQVFNNNAGDFLEPEASRGLDTDVSVDDLAVFGNQSRVPKSHGDGLTKRPLRSGAC